MLFIAAVSAQLCLKFQDEFNGPLDNKVWTHDITLGGGGNWEFEWYTNNRTNSFTENGVLYIKPTLTSDLIGEQAVVKGGTMDLWSSGCNRPGFFGCSRSSDGSRIINPIQSALLRTINSHSIKFGKVEVKAKLPKGDYIWPAIWMLPKHEFYGGWPASGEIDIMESRGNAPAPGYEGYDTFASTLHWGTDANNNRYGLTHKSYKSPKPLSDDFHIYGLLWNSTNIITYIDTPDQVVLNVGLNNFYGKGGFNTNNPWKGSTPAAPFDQEFYLILNVAVGGVNGYFPDPKAWNDKSETAALEFWNKRGEWLPTWGTGNSNALAVDSVRIWSDCQ